MLTLSQLNDIHQKATGAVLAQYGTLSDQGVRGCCGFAWVDVYGLRKNDKNPDRLVLEQAGFSPGLRVQVTCLAPGVIELRSPDAWVVDEINHPRSEPPDIPF